MATQMRIGKTATSVSRDEFGILRVTYHSTPVVTVYPNGRIDLNHGGYMTATTKTRMNQSSNQLHLGFNVWQENFEWFIDVDGRTIPFDESVKTIRYVS